MRRASPGALVLLIGTIGLLVLSTGSAQAGPRTGVVGRSADDARAVALLNGAVAALERTSFTGTRTVSAWGHQGATSALVVDVKHVAGQGTLVSMRGGGVADSMAAFLAAGERGSPQRLDFGIDSVDLLTLSYDVWVGAPGAVAGRPADVVEIGRGAALAARIWVDRASGLPLRREVFDTSGRLAIVSAFIDLAVDDEAFIDHLPPSPPAETAEHVAITERPDLEDRGWACPDQVGSLRLIDIERVHLSAQTPSALHLSYSDGLSRVSVFEQRGVLDDDAVAGFERTQIAGVPVHIREGMPSYAMWESDGMVYTVVSDAPAGTIRHVISSYPHDDAEPGFWGRVGAGFGRLGAWVTPLV